MHKQADDALDTASSVKYGAYSGSFINFPKLIICFSSIFSLSNYNKLLTNPICPIILSEAAHQSVSIFNVSGFFLFSVGFGYNKYVHAYNVYFTGFGGFIIFLTLSISLGSNTSNAFSAFLNAGIASSKSF